MTYVKKGAMIFEVEDDRVQKYINEGFGVYNPSKTPQKEKKNGGKNAKDTE